jgi:hypothetical protein
MMSKTEAKYREALKYVTIHGDIYFNYEHTILMYIYEKVFVSAHRHFYNVDCYETLKNLKELIKDFYILNNYIYSKEDGQVYVSRELISFYTIEYPAVFIFEIYKNKDGKVGSQNLEILHGGDYLEMFKCISFTPEKEVRHFKYALMKGLNFGHKWLEAENMNIDLSKNYNDDLPNDEIMNFINSDSSGLAILYGAPGCGKTSYIRHLIYTADQSFVYLDQSLFTHICDASLIDFLIDNKDSIFILEDCEALLMDRVTTGNTRISTLLNISDGLLGDSLKIKFICTFNCPLSKLDGAIKRKGRLKIQYEFKPLCREKALALAESIGVDLDSNCKYSLAEIYNPADNGVKDKKKIGF